MTVSLESLGLSVPHARRAASANVAARSARPTVTPLRQARTDVRGNGAGRGDVPPGKKYYTAVVCPVARRRDLSNSLVGGEKGVR
jgi:hypothetical protein